MRWRLACLAFLLALLATSSFTTAQSSRTDLNLVVAIDCSYSVNSGEFALQIGGIAAALTDPEVLQTIKQGRHGAIALSIIQWSTASSQVVVVPWARVSSPSEAVHVARSVVNMKRQTAEGGTSIVGALRRSQSLLEQAPYRADRSVVDVIADGENNNGGRVENMRDYLVGLGTTINALAVHNEVTYLHHYMRNRVIGGLGSFVEKAASYNDFRRAFRKKLLREIRGPQISLLQGSPNNG